jgi:hypothetical protein
MVAMCGRQVATGRHSLGDPQDGQLAQFNQQRLVIANIDMTVPGCFLI